jgi:hypothetical protein
MFPCDPRKDKKVQWQRWDQTFNRWGETPSSPNVPWRFKERQKGQWQRRKTKISVSHLPAAPKACHGSAGASPYLPPPRTARRPGMQHIGWETGAGKIRCACHVMVAATEGPVALRSDKSGSPLMDANERESKQCRKIPAKVSFRVARISTEFASIRVYSRVLLLFRFTYYEPIQTHSCRSSMAHMAHRPTSFGSPFPQGTLKRKDVRGHTNPAGDPGRQGAVSRTVAFARLH